jgi:hypothetical protein
VPAPGDVGQGSRLQGLRLFRSLHQGRSVVYDRSPGAGSRFELRQLRHGGHNPFLAPRGQALRIQRPLLMLAPGCNIALGKGPTDVMNRSSRSFLMSLLTKVHGARL